MWLDKKKKNHSLFDKSIKLGTIFARIILFHIRYDTLKLPIISRSKNLTNKIHGKCIVETKKCSVVNILNLYIYIDKQGDGHIQGRCPSWPLACNVKKHGGSRYEAIDL